MVAQHCSSVLSTALNSLVAGLTSLKIWSAKSAKKCHLCASISAHSLHISKVVFVFYYTDQYYFMLFFCMQSDFVIYVNSGVTCNTYLRYIADWCSLDLSRIFFLLNRKVWLQILDQCTHMYNVHTTIVFTYIQRLFLYIHLKWWSLSFWNWLI